MEVSILISKVNGTVSKILNWTVGRVLRTLQKFLPPKAFSEVVDFNLELRNLAVKDSVLFAASSLTDAIHFENKVDLWDYTLSKVAESNSDGVILEFGVFEGFSINHFARRLSNRTIYGFDSFLGLEENWSGYVLTKGHFSLNGSVPKCEPNVNLIVGKFQDTLIPFLEQHQKISISFVHMDADTYLPTSYVLSVLEPTLSSGTIILFDEFFGYPNWRAHEFKAWEEFLANSKLSAIPIAFSECQVAFKLI